MFDSFPMFDVDPKIQAAADSFIKTLQLVPNGHESLQATFLDITMALLVGLPGGAVDGQVRIIEHMEGVVRDVYSRLEVRID